MLRRAFTLVFSDLSIAEITALATGILAFTLGVFLVASREAYIAALTASLVNPRESIPGYIYELDKSIEVPSVEYVKDTAIKVFLSSMVSDKFSYWILYLLSSSITLYPLLARFRNMLIPAFSVIGVSVNKQIWAYLALVAAVSAGFTTVFSSAAIGVYLFYFNAPPDYPMLINVSSVALFMILYSLIAYVASIGLGREYFGITLAFLTSLILDKLSIPTLYLPAIALLCILAVLLALHVMIKRRWISI